MSLCSVVLVVLLVLVAVIVAGCSATGQPNQADTSPIADVRPVDAAPELKVGIDLSCAIAHTPVSVFFRNLVVPMAGAGPVP